jgi:hypothetical protein
MALRCRKEQEYYHILFSLKKLEILHQERRGQVNTTVKKKTLQQHSLTEVQTCYQAAYLINQPITHSH